MIRKKLNVKAAESVNYSDRDMKGINIAGVANVSDGNMKGISLAGWLNYAEEVKDWLISYGTLGNVVDEKRKNSFGLQIGLYNRVGEQYCPIVNVWGIKNIPRLIKKSFRSNKKSLESKLKGGAQ